jgi:hypothetical protein
MPENNTSNTNRPAHTVRHRGIKAVVWLNQTDKGPMHNVTLSRVYRDGEEWKESRSMGFDDLMTAAKALFDAHTWISQQRETMNRDEPSNEKPSGKDNRRAEKSSRQPSSV